MGWNGSDTIHRQDNCCGAEACNRKDKNATSRMWLLIGSVVVAGGIVAAWVFSGLGSSSVANQSELSRQSSIPNASSKAKQKKPYTPPEKRHVEPTGDKLADAIAKVESTAETIKIEPPKQSVKPKTKAIFKTGTEQLMCWLVSVEPGDPPMPVPPLDDYELKHLAEVLISKNEITEEDTELSASLKEGVDYCKKEMMKFIKDGGDPNDFMKYYFHQLNSAFEMRSEVQDQYDELKADDPEMAKAFLKKANGLLEEKGIKQVLSDEEEATEDDNGQSQSE